MQFPDAFQRSAIKCGLIDAIISFGTRCIKKEMIFYDPYTMSYKFMTWLVNICPSSRNGSVEKFYFCRPSTDPDMNPCGYP